MNDGLQIGTVVLYMSVQDIRLPIARAASNSIVVSNKLWDNSICECSGINTFGRMWAGRAWKET